MGRVRNILEPESYRGNGVRTVSGVTLTLIICSLFSGMAAISIIANLGAVTARIAIFIAKLLSSGLPILVVIATVVYFSMRLIWRLRRAFWRW